MTVTATDPTVVHDLIAAASDLLVAPDEWAAAEARADLADALRRAGVDAPAGDGYLAEGDPY